MLPGRVTALRPRNAGVHAMLSAPHLKS